MLAYNLDPHQTARIYILRQSEKLHPDQAARMHNAHRLSVYNLGSGWTARMGINTPCPNDVQSLVRLRGCTVIVRGTVC